MKSNVSLFALITIFLVMIPAVISAQIITKRVSFPKGKTSTVIEGSMAGDQTIDYVVGARAGQNLVVTLTPKTNQPYFNVLPPGSDDAAVFIGQNDGNECNISLEQSGDYKIRVYQMRSAARRGEKATYTLKIEIPAASHDAKVPGTNYHATGEIDAAIGQDKTTAEFGVIRSNGGAEVHTTLKSTGVKRVFVFSQGVWKCKSSGCQFSFSKIKSDEWELICNGTEKYYIFEAVVYGG